MMWSLFLICGVVQVEKVDFDRERLQRLREALHVSKDKELAEALGLGEKAFNARKARNSFPVKELYALAAKRPDLKIDVAYVLTGITSEAHSRLNDLQAGLDLAAVSGAGAFSEMKMGGQLMAQQMGQARPTLSPDELALLTDYRALDARAKAGVRALMAGITPLAK